MTLAEIVELSRTKLPPRMQDGASTVAADFNERLLRNLNCSESAKRLAVDVWGLSQGSRQISPGEATLAILICPPGAKSCPPVTVTPSALAQSHGHPCPGWYR